MLSRPGKGAGTYWLQYQIDMLTFGLQTCTFLS